MDTSLKQNGPIGERFEKERTYFEKEANYAFFKAMVSFSQSGLTVKSENIIAF